VSTIAERYCWCLGGVEAVSATTVWLGGDAVSTTTETYCWCLGGGEAVSMQRQTP
jgi:hypothetical protein